MSIIFVAAADDPVATLRESRDPDKLVAAARDVCDSLDTAAIDQLTTLLLKPTLQDRLDSADDYQFRHFRDLKVTQVLTAIAKLPSDQAEAQLARCARDPCFLLEDKRLDALIYATGEVHQPSASLLGFVDGQGTPKNGSTLVVAALARMATDESCALIEKRFLSRAYDKYDKVGWLHSVLVPLRDRPAVARLYRRMIKAPIEDDAVREALVQSLFDYRPKEWYGTSPSHDTDPPKWEDCSTSVLEELVRIADTADKLDVSDEAKAGVAKARKEIKAVLTGRQKRNGQKKGTL